MDAVVQLRVLKHKTMKYIQKTSETCRSCCFMHHISSIIQRLTFTNANPKMKGSNWYAVKARETRPAHRQIFAHHAMPSSIMKPPDAADLRTFARRERDGQIT